MHTYYNVKDMLHDELADIVKKGELSAGSLDTIDKLLHSIKNADKIIMYEEYTKDGYSYRDADRDMTDYSTGRGRYSRARDGRRTGRGDYSYHDEDKNEKIELLRDMMHEATSDEDRRTIQKIIRKMEQS